MVERSQPVTGVAVPVRWMPRFLSRPSATQSLIPPFQITDFSPAIKTRLLILQPTPFCNINCDYCYLPNRSSTGRMELATVRHAAERLRDDQLLGETLTVVWHAGEPLAMPIGFYEDAITTVQSAIGPHCRVTHSIQTNATLIDEAWCTLFKRHGIQVGVSVDGPQDLHDAHRKSRTGRGTHDRVLRGMALLRDAAISFHAIAVVTPATFAQADAFFDFFLEQGVSEVGCNYDEAEGLHRQSSLSGHEAAHDAFVARLLQRASSDPRLRVRELAMALRLIAQPLPRQAWRGHHWPDNAQTLPFALVTVAHNGDFSTFSPELLGQPSAEFGNFILGNVASSGYVAATRSERFTRLWNSIVRGILACERGCAHFAYCGGGAPANKLYENGDLTSTETLYCRTMVKRPFDAVLEKLERCDAHDTSVVNGHGKWS